MEIVIAFCVGYTIGFLTPVVVCTVLAFVLCAAAARCEEVTDG